MLKWLGGIADTQLRENVERAVVSEWMRNDPDAALDWVLGFAGFVLAFPRPIFVDLATPKV